MALAKTPARSLLGRIQKVELQKLKPYPKNPRRGNVDAIARSLKENGQFQPLIVQKSTNYVLSGNHTLKAMVKLGWDKADATYVDVTDEAAVKIMLAANRTADLATYDTEALEEVLRSVPDVSGTGWTEEERSAILNAAANQEIDLSEVINPSTSAEDQIDTILDNAADFGSDIGDGDGDLGSEPVDDSDEGEFEKAPDQLKGSLQLADEPQFDGVGYWGITRLLPNMLLRPEDVPTDLKSWGEFASRDSATPDDNWFLNYGQNSYGIKDFSKVILAFYQWDDKFEVWWDDPAKYTTKALNAGIRRMVSPNYTTPAGEPMVVSLMATYKSRWLGRYFQEAGIRVAPDIGWPRENLDFLEKHVLTGLPKKVPVVSMQRQTFDSDAQPEYYEKLRQAYEMIVDKLHPEIMLMYTGNAGKQFISKLGLKTDVRFLESARDLQTQHRKQTSKSKTGPRL